jgi:hypothetical protein
MKDRYRRCFSLVLKACRADKRQYPVNHPQNPESRLLSFGERLPKITKGLGMSYVAIFRPGKLIKYIATALLAFAPSELEAVENLRIEVQGSNAVLSWPSATGDTYIVEYRERFIPETPWQTLASNYPAKSETNQTIFIHSNVVAYPPPCGTNTTNVLVGPPGFDGMSTIGAEVGSLFQSKDGELSTLEELLPYPWNPRYQPQGLRSDTAVTESAPGGDPCPSATNSTGFYRVVKVGVTFFGITNRTLVRGQVTLPIEIGLDTTLPLESVSASAGTNSSENVPLQGFSITTFAAGGIQASWDTTQTTNGAYQINIAAQLGGERISNSPPVTLLVSNDVWFPDSFNMYGYFVEVQAQSVHANGTYHVEIYDDTGFNIVSLDGPLDSAGYVTFDGIRGFRVRNYDPDTFEQYPSIFHRVVLTTTRAGGQNLPGATAVATNFLWHEDPWPSNTVDNFYTQFAIAYQPVFGNPANGGVSAVALQTMVQSWYGLAEARAGDLGVVRGGSQYPFELWTQLDFTSLLTDLDNDEVRNFFYFGHGSAETIGQRSMNPPRYLDKANLNLGLNNFPHISPYGWHPYRFVFLDGCNTAKGDLCKVFGIPKERNVPGSRFSNKGLRYRAFMGWDKPLIVGWAGAIDNTHVNFMTKLLQKWPEEKPSSNPPRPYTLREAVDLAKVAYQTAIDHLIIYGYEGLWFDDTLP